MARPSVKEERQAEILAAFSRCIAKYGLAGSSLEKVAEESGIKRPLIRHFVGNRENLLALLEEQVTAQYKKELAAFVSSLPGQGRSKLLVEAFFSTEASSSYEQLSVMLAFIMESQNNPDLRQNMKAWFQDFESTLQNCLKADYPKATEAQIRVISFGIISSYFNIDSLSPLALEESYRKDAYAVAQTLLETLEDK